MAWMSSSCPRFSAASMAAASKRLEDMPAAQISKTLYLAIVIFTCNPQAELREGGAWLPPPSRSVAKGRYSSFSFSKTMRSQARKAGYQMIPGITNSVSSARMIAVTL